MIKEIKVDSDKCTGCRMCTHVCLNNVIEWDDMKNGPVARYPEDCVLCLICAMYCPAQAMELVPDYMKAENDAITMEVGAYHQPRPQWDVQLLIEVGFERVTVDKDIAKVSVVGAGMMSSMDVASLVFEALNDAHINIRMISTSEIKLSCVIERSAADRAVSAIHGKFFES